MTNVANSNEIHSPIVGGLHALHGAVWSVLRRRGAQFAGAISGGSKILTYFFTRNVPASNGEQYSFRGGEYRTLFFDMVFEATLIVYIVIR